MRIAGLALLLVSAVAQDPPPKPWIGVSMTAESKLPAVEGVAAKSAVRVADVVPDSPAEKAGLRPGDLIVALDGRAFEVDAKEVLVAFRDAISSRSVGDELKVSVIRDVVDVLRDGKPAPELLALEDWLKRQPPGTEVELKGRRRFVVLELTARLSARPAGVGAKRIPADLKLPHRDWPEERLAEALLKAKGLEADQADLRKRLESIHASADRFRLARVAHVHRHPFQLRTLGDLTLGHVLDDPFGWAAEWLDAPTRPAPALERGGNLEAHLEQLVACVADASALIREAFAPLTEEERKFVDANLDALTERFAEHIYLESDPDRSRWSRHSRVLALAARVDAAKLFEAARRIAAVSSRVYLDDLKRALEEEWEAKGRPGGVFVSRDTKAGRLLVAGHERTWHREDAAILLDLGGDDFYSQNAGSGRGAAAVLIDFAGNDAYEATFPWTQGAGRMGAGLLIDRAGNDSYLGTRWAQGAAALGVGRLHDESGDDVYRGEAYVQAVGLWGVGLLEDDAGADRYEARLLSQAVGMPGGAGFLIEGTGDDRYFAKGRNPTSYGDAGIFDGWSQACGVGFRGHQSGGVGLILEAGGHDVFEAGNFSQGGGYYYGIGLFRDMSGNDRYIGSRYNQGFSAHQAAGYFEDMSGDDRYDTRQAVAQGLAWDQCVTFFVDGDGDDVYDGGGFSQAASAHNSVSIVLDLGGRDEWRRVPRQAAAGPNDYHGGTSLSLFLDLGGAADGYDGDERNSAIVVGPGHGFACDLPASIEEALKDEVFRKLMR